jgi:hypothetical protein
MEVVKLSMSSSDLHIGAVFQTEWDSRPIRVIAFDEEQVMYDCWWPHIPGWGIESLNRDITYYRTPTCLLLSKSKYLRTEEYTEAELSIHRPDLPFGFAQFANLEWPSMCPATPVEFPCSAAASTDSRSSKPVLDAAKIYLQPFGPKGSSKPGIVLEAEKASGFTMMEVLWHAAQLQSPFLREIKVTTGIGIYRSGIRRKLPSYYIWGAKSRMET